MPRAVGRGEISKLEAEIRKLLQDCTGAQKLRLEFELDRIARWRYEFPYRLEERFCELQKIIPDLSWEEVRGLLTRGCLDHAIIDGEVRLLRRFVPNALWLCPELKQRRKKGKDGRGWTAIVALKERARRVVEAASQAGSGYVLPLRYRVRAEIAVKHDAVLAGETLRVWIPLPRVSGLHSEVRVLEAEPQPKRIAPENHPQRTAYIEVEQGIEGARCSIEYEFVARRFRGSGRARSPRRRGE